MIDVKKIIAQCEFLKHNYSFKIVKECLIIKAENKPTFTITSSLIKSLLEIKDEENFNFYIDVDEDDNRPMVLIFD